jgi:hypothetical protein
VDEWKPLAPTTTAATLSLSSPTLILAPAPPPFPLLRGRLRVAPQYEIGRFRYIAKGEMPIQSCGQSVIARRGKAGARLNTHTELRARRQRSAREAIYRNRPVESITWKRFVIVHFLSRKKQALARRVLTEGLHSLTFRLNVSTLCGTYGIRRVVSVTKYGSG